MERKQQAGCRAEAAGERPGGWADRLGIGGRAGRQTGSVRTESPVRQTAA